MQEKSFYESVGYNHLNRIKLLINEWLWLMSSDSVFADELMLYVLSRTYRHHTVLFTSTKCWSTIGTDEPISGQRLLEICQVHLAYIGQHMYGELKLRPFTALTGPMILDSPTQAIPVNENSDNKDDTDCSIQAMDLTTQKSHDKADDTTSDNNTDLEDNSTMESSCTITSSDSLRVSCDKTSLKENVNETQELHSAGSCPDMSEESDTPSESLLNPVAKLRTKNILGENTDGTIGDMQGLNNLNLSAIPKDSNSKTITHDMLGTNSSFTIATMVNLDLVMGINRSSPSIESDEINCENYEHSDCVNKTPVVTASVQHTMNITDGVHTDSSRRLTPLNANNAQKCLLGTNKSEATDKKIDIYKDAPLSGTLEKINLDTNAILDMIAQLQINNDKTGSNTNEENVCNSNMVSDHCYAISSKDQTVNHVDHNYCNSGSTPNLQSDISNALSGENNVMELWANHLDPDTSHSDDSGVYIDIAANDVSYPASYIDATLPIANTSINNVIATNSSMTLDQSNSFIQGINIEVPGHERSNDNNVINQLHCLNCKQNTEDKVKGINNVTNCELHTE